jgi:AcrR family transcriptional regulator
VATKASAKAINPDQLPAWQLATRQRIIKAASKALNKQPYDQIQVRDIAKSADVALATLYRYFGSKEHLYAVTLTEWTEPVFGRSHSSSDLGAEARVRSKVHLVAAAFEKTPHFFTMVYALQGSQEPTVQKLIEEWSETGRQWTVSDLAVLGEERAHDLAQMLWAITSTLLTRALHNGTSFEAARRVADAFIDLIADELHQAEHSG